MPRGDLKCSHFVAATVVGQATPSCQGAHTARTQTLRPLALRAQLCQRNRLLPLGLRLNRALLGSQEPGTIQIPLRVFDISDFGKTVRWLETHRLYRETWAQTLAALPNKYDPGQVP